MTKPPCKTCDKAKKYPVCRDSCQLYKQWKEKREMELEAKRKAENEDRIYWEVRKTGWDEH